MADFKGQFGKNDANFTKDSLIKLGALRAKLAVDYGGFFRKMMKVYSPKGPQYKELEAGLKLTNASMFYIDTLMGKKGRPATVEEFKLLSQRLDELTAQMGYFTTLYAKSVKFKKEVDRLEMESGVSLEHIAGVSGELGGEVEKAFGGMQGKASFIKQYAPGIGEGIGRLGKGAMTAALGPFTPLAEMAMGTFRGIRKGIRSQRKQQEQAGWMSRFGPGGIDMSQMDMRGAIGQRAGGHGLGGVFNDPLSSFYNTGAYHAKYTKEMLASMKKMSGSGAGSLSQSIGSSMAGGFGKALMPVVAVLGIILAAIIGWKAGGLIDKFVGNKVDKTFGKGTYDDFWLGMFSGGKQGKGKFGKTIGKLSPLMQLSGMAFPDMPSAEGNDSRIPLASALAQQGVSHKDMDLSPAAVQAYAMNGLGETIKTSIKDIGKGTDKQEQVVIPKSVTSSRHRDSDPLTDKLNRTDED